MDVGAGIVSSGLVSEVFNGWVSVIIVAHRSIFDVLI